MMQLCVVQGGAEALGLPAAAAAEGLPAADEGWPAELADDGGALTVLVVVLAQAVIAARAKIAAMKRAVRAGLRVTVLVLSGQAVGLMTSDRSPQQGQRPIAGTCGSVPLRPTTLSALAYSAAQR